MEMCGGQTHALLQSGIDQLLSPEITFIHGPGCPVCVTPQSTIDKAIRLANHQDVILTTYGDMLRVPGTDISLATARAAGADVRVVYAALDALTIARETPNKQVVFLGIGFETTAPANGISVIQSARLGITNYSMLSYQVRVPSALKMILDAEDNRVQAFLAAGHVCAVMGTAEYLPISQQYQVPISVTGFEPVDLLAGIDQVVSDLESGQWQVQNAYSRSVSASGNPAALAIIDEVFEPCAREWRGIGQIPDSGWKIKDQFSAFDAEKKFDLAVESEVFDSVCIAGQILLGQKLPLDCPAFARNCSPEHPLGAAMVSSEGTCAAYYRYRREYA